MEFPVRLAVFGDPVDHSLSPQMHNAALEHLGLPFRYGRFRVRPGELREALEARRRENFIGVNLTIPHKLDVLPLLDEITPQAKLLGAVNTVTFREDGRLAGANTDGPGLVRSVRSASGREIRGQRIVSLGAGGGAGRAAAVQCALEGCARLALVNRSVEKIGPLVSEIAALPGNETMPDVVGLALADEGSLRAEMEQADLVVNATSLGLKADDGSPLPDGLLEARHFVCDMVYARQPTALARMAAAAGAGYTDGLSLLLHQGALALEIWLGQPAPVEVMARAIGAGQRIMDN